MSNVINCPRCGGNGRIYPATSNPMHNGKICPECRGMKQVQGTPEQIAAEKQQKRER